MKSKKINMMGRFSLSLIAVFMVTTSCSEVVSDLNSYGLKGKVKSVTETKFVAELAFDDIKAGGKIGYKRIAFDKQGCYESITEFNNRDQIVAKTTPFRGPKKEIIDERVYNANGDMIMLIEQEKLADNHYTFTYYAPDHNGYIAAKTDNQYENKLISKKTEQQFVHEELTQTLYYEYNYKDILVDTYTCKEDPEDMVFKTVRYHYDKFDEKGNWTRAITFCEDPMEEPEYVITRSIIYY